MKTVDLQELSTQPGTYAEKIRAGEVYTLTYRGKVIAELRRARTQQEEAGSYDQVLSEADLLRAELENWRAANGIPFEDSIETLDRLREEHDLAGLH